MKANSASQQCPKANSTNVKTFEVVSGQFNIIKPKFEGFISMPYTVTYLTHFIPKLISVSNPL